MTQAEGGQVAPEAYTAGRTGVKEPDMSNWREQLAPWRAQVHEDFQQIIDYIKGQVEPGLRYENALVRVVLSERGCYYEFVEFPEEFSGVLGGGYQHEFVSSGAGWELMESLERLLREH